MFSFPAKLTKYMVLTFLFSVTLSGCVTKGSSEVKENIKNQGLAVGFILLEPHGPYFRPHQDEVQVRFFDLINKDSRERTRVFPEEGRGNFLISLASGEYELGRMQFSEGPFRSESQFIMSFQVYEEKVTYLGVWRMRVDPPKTVRNVRLDVIADAPDWDPLLAARPELKKRPVLISLPQPITSEFRLYGVESAQPKARYFRRR